MLIDVLKINIKIIGINKKFLRKTMIFFPSINLIVINIKLDKE